MDRLVSHHGDCPLVQHPHYAEALRQIGVAADLRELAVGKRVVGRAVVLSRRIAGLRRVAMTSRGPLWRDDSSIADQGQALRDARIDIVNASRSGGDIVSHAGYLRVITGAAVAELSLTEDWLSRARPKWRNRLVQARLPKSAIEARRFDPSRDDWLLTRCARQARARRYRDLPPAFIRAFAAANPKSVQVMHARAGGEVIASMLFLSTGRVATYQLGWCGDQGRAADAHRVILAEAIPWLRDMGHGRLDLGTVATDDAPGLARFKLGTGANLVTLGGSWIRLPLWAARQAHPYRKGNPASLWPQS